MNKEEAIVILELALKKHGFVYKDSSNESHLDLKHTKCYAYYYCYDNNCGIQFHGDVVKQPKNIYYKMDDKYEVSELKARAREIAKKARNLEEIKIEEDNKQIVKYKEILNAIVENKISFPFNVSRAHNSYAALININGYNIRVNSVDFKIRISIGGEYRTVPIALAIEIANILPAT